MGLTPFGPLLTLFFYTYHLYAAAILEHLQIDFLSFSTFLLLVRFWTDNIRTFVLYTHANLLHAAGIRF